MNRIKLIKLNSSFHFNFVEDENRLDSIKDCRVQTEIIYLQIGEIVSHVPFFK